MAHTTQTKEFRRFAEDNWDALLRTATLLAGSRAAGEDLMQEALIRTLTSWNRVDPDRALAYTRRVMANLCTDRWRRKRFEPIPTDDDQLARRGGADQGFSRLEDRDQILQELAALSQRERTIVVLRFYCDLPEKDVAEQLAVSLGTVKSTCSRALAKLRAQSDVVMGA